MKEKETLEPRTVEGKPMKNTSVKSLKIKELLDRVSHNVTEKNASINYVRWKDKAVTITFTQLSKPIKLKRLLHRLNQSIME